MRGNVRQLARAALIGAALLGGAGAAVMPASARAETRIGLDKALDLAGRMLRMRRPAAALALVEGVLQGRPEDVPALVLKSRALRDLGRADEAAQAADAARIAAGAADVSTSSGLGESDRFYAALVTGQARAAQGRKGIAQYWLRHAAEIAPDDVTRAVAVRDFRAVRRSNPLRINLNLFLEPSDNLNSAPKQDSVPLNPFFSLQLEEPLSGLRYGASIDMRYTKALTARSRLHFDSYGGGSLVDLSRAAKEIEGADAGALSTGYLGFGVTGEQMAASRDRIWRAGLSLTRQFAGGAALADVARVHLGHDLRLGKTWTASLSARAARQFRLDTETDIDEASLGLRVQRPLGKGVLQLGLERDRVRSDAATLEHDGVALSLGYRMGRPVAGLLPRLSLEYEATDYKTAPVLFSGDARHDREWVLSVDVLMPKLDYMGFAPELGLSFRDRQSNYSHLDVQSTDLRIGLKSVF